VLLVHDGSEVVETAVAQHDPIAHVGQGRRRRRDGVGIPIESEQTQIGPSAQEEPGVPCSSDGGVDQPARRNRLEDPNDLLGHHRDVLERDGHVNTDAPRVVG
jgi:hypothetical protein